MTESERRKLAFCREITRAVANAEVTPAQAVACLVATINELIARSPDPERVFAGVIRVMKKNWREYGRS